MKRERERGRTEDRISEKKRTEDQTNEKKMEGRRRPNPGEEMQKKKKK